MQPPTVVPLLRPLSTCNRQHYYVRLDLFGDDVLRLARHGSGSKQQSGEPI